LRANKKTTNVAISSNKRPVPENVQKLSTK
jgi:hypothetical protein